MGGRVVGASDTHAGLPLPLSPHPPPLHTHRTSHLPFRFLNNTNTPPPTHKPQITAVRPPQTSAPETGSVAHPRQHDTPPSSHSIQNTCVPGPRGTASPATDTGRRGAATTCRRARGRGGGLDVLSAPSKSSRLRRSRPSAPLGAADTAADASGRQEGSGPSSRRREGKGGAGGPHSDSGENPPWGVRAGAVPDAAPALSPPRWPREECPISAISLQLSGLFQYLSLVRGICSSQKIDLGHSGWKRVLSGKSQRRAKGVGSPAISDGHVSWICSEGLNLKHSGLGSPEVPSHLSDHVSLLGAWKIQSPRGRPTAGAQQPSAAAAGGKEDGCWSPWTWGRPAPPLALCSLYSPEASVPSPSASL